MEESMAEGEGKGSIRLVNGRLKSVSDFGELKMPGSPKKRERRERMEDFEGDPEAVSELIGEIACGVTTLQIEARVRDLPYNRLVECLTSSSDRSERYKDALEIAKAHQAARILEELSYVALADIREAFDEFGNLLPVHELPEHIARAISGIEVTEEFAGRGDLRVKTGTTKKVRFVEKNRALELAAKILGMLIEKREITKELTLEELLVQGERDED